MGDRSILRRMPNRLGVAFGVVALLGSLLSAPTVLAGAASAPIFVTAWGSNGSGNGQFLNGGYYVGVAVDASTGSVYVTDNGNNRVEKFTSSGTYLTQWGSFGSDNGQFKYPYGIAVDNSGNVYVADASNNRIEKFDSSGAYLTQWGSGASPDGRFGAFGVALDGSGNVYVADPGNNRVQKFTSSGSYLTQWGSSGTGNGQFIYPTGIAVDGSGNVYVTDPGNNRIEEFTSSGAYLTQWGSSGTGDGQFLGPIGISTGGTGNIYVTDTPNSRIEEFAPAPITAPDAPTGVIAAPGNAIASVSWLAPVSDGGAAIVGYTVTPHDVSTDSAGPTYPASGTTATVPGLTPGDSYQFSVTATNSVGPSSDSAWSDSVTLPVTPGPTTPPPATATGTASMGSTTTVSTATSPPPGGTATSVVVPAGTAGGTVSIAEIAVTGTPPSGYSFVDQQVNITAPVATADNPLVFDFQIDASALTAAGVDATTVSVFRNGSLVLDCVDPLANGASPDPCVASRVTLLPSGAADLTIRTSQASHWNFGKGGFRVTGFFQPVDNRPVINSVKAGSAIPVKFSLGANQGLNIFTTGYPRSAQTACDSSAPVDAIDQTVTAGGSSLSYDPNANQYTYIWKTDKTWSAAPGGPCRQLVLSFVDGHFLRANFKFK
jgi:DNA-binding beta-propeller fold protein YncE